jgi:hypothetical protein
MRSPPPCPRSRVAGGRSLSGPHFRLRDDGAPPSPTSNSKDNDPAGLPEVPLIGPRMEGGHIPSGFDPYLSLARIGSPDLTATCETDQARRPCGPSLSPCWARSARPCEGAGTWSLRTLPSGNNSLCCTTARSGRSSDGSTEPSGFSYPAAGRAGATFYRRCGRKPLSAGIARAFAPGGHGSRGIEGQDARR